MNGGIILLDDEVQRSLYTENTRGNHPESQRSHPQRRELLALLFDLGKLAPVLFQPRDRLLLVAYPVGSRGLEEFGEPLDLQHRRLLGS